MWLFGDLSFFREGMSETEENDEKIKENKKENKRQYRLKNKAIEDVWGQSVLKLRRPDLKLDKQWTNKFGEHLCEEILKICGKEVKKPCKKEHYLPDCEVDDAIWEVKTGTFHTDGTAGEKILGCPFKYADIPCLYNKPLRIMCIGGSEMICREQYGNLSGVKCTTQKQKFLEFFRQNNIEYVGATDILKKLVENEVKEL